jgi:hypothetical protein
LKSSLDIHRSIRNYYRTTKGLTDSAIAATGKPATVPIVAP